MPSEQMEFTVATLALRPDATSVHAGARCWVIDIKKEYRARDGVWYELLDNGQGDAGGGGAGVDITITQWADLAALDTVDLTPGLAGSIKLWVEASANQLHCSRLQTSTAATNTAAGVQRPHDFHADTNPKVWVDQLL